MEEVLEALRPAERAAIIPALHEVRREMTTAADLAARDQEGFVNEIGTFVKLTGGGWPQSQREEFIQQAAIDLAEYPVVLVVEAIAEARKRVWEPKRFVSWIVERIEPAAAKLKAEEDRLVRIADATGAA